MRSLVSSHSLSFMTHTVHACVSETASDFSSYYVCMRVCICWPLSQPSLHGVLTHQFSSCTYTSSLSQHGRFCLSLPPPLPPSHPSPRCQPPLVAPPPVPASCCVVAHWCQRGSVRGLEAGRQAVHGAALHGACKQRSTESISEPTLHGAWVGTQERSRQEWWCMLNEHWLTEPGPRDQALRGAKKLTWHVG